MFYDIFGGIGKHFKFETLSRLSALRLGEYEAKACISLLRANPATAYEIARSSGIPKSKVCEVVNRRIKKGIISSLDEEKKRRYIPIAPR